MLVRAAGEDDVEAIGEVHVRSWQHAYRGHVPDDYLAGLSVAQRIDAWRSILASCDPPASGMLVLEAAHRVVGFAHYSRSRDPDASADTGEVTSMYLAPEVWRRGGGRLLMDAVTAALPRGRYREATLWVLDSNVSAKAFYAAMGWRHDGQRKIDDRGGLVLSELRYRRPLTGTR